MDYNYMSFKNLSKSQKRAEFFLVFAEVLTIILFEK